MLMGISFQANPTKFQRQVLSQWMGCARFIWNAKCEEDEYLRYFSKRMPSLLYPPIDQKFSQYKNKDLSPWLFDCPSQILRNSASNWYHTYRNFIKGICKKSKRKKKTDWDSVHLTRELFRFEKCEDGVVRLFIGTKRNNIGYLSLKTHKKVPDPNSIRIRKKAGRYVVSFCYEDGLSEDTLKNIEDHFSGLRCLGREKLESMTEGIDRGVKRPVQTTGQTFDLTEEQKKKKKKKEKFIKRSQRRLASQQKGSKRRVRTKQKLSKSFEKIRNIRKDFCHKTSRAIVDDQKIEVIVLEDLRTKNMTKKPKAKKNKDSGKWEKNGAKRKSGLNRSILDNGWHQFENFLKYKAYRKNKALFKISAYQTSQECADCDHTHPNNRKSQELFVCENCGNRDNADHNAALVIKKRAIKLILYSGTELSKRGVLLDRGRGADDQTLEAKVSCAHGKEASKKMGFKVA